MTLLVDPPVTLDPINQVLHDLAACLCAQIEMDGTPPPCFCGVVPGAEVALEYAGDCDSACGMAWVRLDNAYPSVTVGAPSDRTGNCSAGIGIEVEIGIVRCLSVGEGAEPPTAEALQEAATLQAADMLTMWRAVNCCRRSKDFLVGQYQTFGPEGGLVGGILPVAVLVI